MKNIKHYLLLVLTQFVLLFGSVHAELLSTTYYHNDALGSPIAATSETGAVKWRENYHPYGDRINNAAAASDNSRWYTGHVHDQSTGLTYAGARYYDPVVGRFMAVDPVDFSEGNAQSFNRYAYANNNPYRFVDPDGENPILLGRLAVQLVIRGVVWVSERQAGAVVIAETSAAIATGAVTPNSVLVGPAASSVANVAKATTFRNLAPSEAIGDAITFPASQILKVSYSGNLNYVVKETGELVIGRTGHTSLASGADVLAAGEARFVNGNLRSLNNSSGHYKPAGLTAQQSAESAFEGAGFNAAGTYSEKL